MTKLKYCFLDMDGVIADFVKGVCAAHGKETPYTKPESFGIFDMEKLWGISSQEFWKTTEYSGFWRNLEKYEDADELVSFLCSVFGTENICILTSPSESPFCIPEKKAWIGEHFPQFKKQILFGSAKHFLAGPDRVLIDDRDKNIETFINAGGVGWTYSRLWNCLWPFSDDPVNHLRLTSASDLGSM